MSGTGEERSWRNSGGQQVSQPRPSNQQRKQSASYDHSSGDQPNTKLSLGKEQGMTAVSGNVWATNDRGSGPPHEKHTSVNGFNAHETRDALRKGYNIATSSPEGKLLRYKAPGGQAGNVKAGGPWASKPNTMANGKDFFLELRKQMSTLQHSSERAGG